MQNKVDLTVSIHILQVAPAMGFDSAAWSKPHRCYVYISGVEELSAQNGHWEDALAPEIYDVLSSIRPDIDWSHA